jgi:hypothetical protein
MVKEIKFTKAYNDILTDTNVNAIEYRVYMVLSMFDIEGTGIIDNVSYAKIGELVGLSSCRARQVIASLIKKEYVVKNNKNIGKNNTRNIYILPKKIERDRLAKIFKKMDKKDILLSSNNNQLDSSDENLSTSGEKLSTEGSESSLPIYTKVNTDDDIESKIKELKEKEGEEVVSKALEKMEKYDINKKGFISYLIKTIESIKKYTYSKINTYIHKKNYNKRLSTFNNFKQRNYNWDLLKKALTGHANIGYSDCLIE